jgi:hypothetical protein
MPSSECMEHQLHASYTLLCRGARYFTYCIEIFRYKGVGATTTEQKWINVYVEVACRTGVATTRLTHVTDAARAICL